VKLEALLCKMVKAAAFGICSIYNSGIIQLEDIRKQRRANKTHLNIHKHFYKIELMIAMKSRARLQWAFYRVTKLTPTASVNNL
jgi:uncharacterized protein (DUF3084 family)